MRPQSVYTCAALLWLLHRRRLRKTLRYKRCNQRYPKRNNKESNGYTVDNDSELETNRSTVITSDEVTFKYHKEFQWNLERTRKRLPSRKLPAKCNRSPQHKRIALHVTQQNVTPQQNHSESNTTFTMRRYPPRESFPKYSIRPQAEATNGYTPYHPNMPPPIVHGDPFARHMAEIEYWVKTHRPPCTYGMAPPPSLQTQNAVPIPQNLPNNIAPAAKAPEIKNEIQHAEIKRPVDPPDNSPEKNTRKRRLKVLGDESESTNSHRNEYFPASLGSSQTPVHKVNGSCALGRTGQLNKTAGTPNSKNLDVSSESTKNSRARPTSTPILNRAKNVDAGKKANSVANKAPPRRTRLSKALQRNAIVAGSKVDSTVQASTAEATAGPSNAVGGTVPQETRRVFGRDTVREIVDDSDTSILTAPYIRSTRNSASKSKCQTLTRQRASQAKANKYFPRGDTCEESANPCDAAENSQVTNDSIAANNTGNGGLTDSSLEIFTTDVPNESSHDIKSISRVSSTRKTPTLHFTGPSTRFGRSEPVATRMSTKRSNSLLSNGCKIEVGHANLSSDKNEEQLEISARNLSTPCISRTEDVKNRSRVLCLLESDDDSPKAKRKFF